MITPGGEKVSNTIRSFWLDRIARQKQVPPRKPVKKPDPKETYSFAVGSSPVKGAKDAWVTIVEVSEFQ